MKKRPSLGAHVSVAGGLLNGIKNAERIGAECIQLFGASPRAFAVGRKSPDEIAEFKKARDKAGVEQVFLHGAYLVNLASPDSSLRERSEVNLAGHLAIAESIGADGLIFHIGSGKEMPKSDALDIVVEAIKRILGFVKGNASLVIENSAGGGQTIGSSPREVGNVIERVGSHRLKVCWDTAHAFEAGQIEKYDESGVRALVQSFKDGFELDNLVAFHINDSKTPFNSKHDRHENLGEGHIGLDGFKNLAKARELYHAAWILEVPGFDDMGPDKKNLDILKSCFT